MSIETPEETEKLIRRYGTVCFTEGYMRQHIVYIEPPANEVAKTPKAAHLDLSFWLAMVPQVYRDEVKAIAADVGEEFMKLYGGQKADKRTRYIFIEELRERILRLVRGTNEDDPPPDPSRAITRAA